MHSGTGAPALLPVSHLIRPERPAQRPGWLDRFAHEVRGYLPDAPGTRLTGLRRLARRVLELEAELSGLSEEALDRLTLELRATLQREGFGDENLVRTFALVREVSHRTLGLRHFESQLIGGLALFRGDVAEMATGEGKTLAATLPACAAALAGVPVHVVTVNDYLTARDADITRPVYQRLGLSVACIVHDMDPSTRRPVELPTVAR